MTKVTQALISVSDKTNLDSFAQQLIALNINILSTGGTYQYLRDAGIPVTEVSEYTDFQEIMDGRVKTLHPKIHGGILGRRDIDAEVMLAQNITPIDLVVVNLYPFSATVQRQDCTFDMAIENIDIGGPAMLRSAAKNHAYVTVVTDTKDYNEVLEELKTGHVSQATRQHLALKAFTHTCAYDQAISQYLQQREQEQSTLKKHPNKATDPFPEKLNLSFTRSQVLRYGENPHQTAGFYVSNDNTNKANIATAHCIQGKALSYNNIADTNTALECVKLFSTPACVIVKHANPCGVALADNIIQAYDKAYQTDPTSAFGGIIAFNQALDMGTAQRIIERQFVEVIIAPSISPQAQKILASKPNIRVLECPQWPGPSASELHYSSVSGGLLVQDTDQSIIDASQVTQVTQRSPSKTELDDLMFAWKVAKFVKSNAIVYAKQGMCIGIGAGQMSRVYSAKIASIKAHDENLQVSGSVMASDAFFPFSDSVEMAAAAGISAIIQPGGSMRDEEVIACADEHNIAMVFTGMRHFRH